MLINLSWNKSIGIDSLRKLLKQPELPEWCAAKQRASKVLPGRELSTHRPLWGSLISIIDRFTDFYLKLHKCLLIDWYSFENLGCKSDFKINKVLYAWKPYLESLRGERTFAEPPSSLPLIREDLARAPSWVSPAPEGTGPHLIPQVRDIPDAQRSHLQSLAPSSEEAGIHTHGKLDRTSACRDMSTSFYLVLKMA